MLSYIRKKIWIIRFEAKRSEKSPLAFFLSKTFKWIDKQLALYLDLLAILVFYPVAMIVRASSRRGPGSKVLLVGLEHVVDKIAVRGEYFRQKGYEVEYLSFEYSGLRASSVGDKELTRFRKYLFQDIFMLIRKFARKPAYVEIYFEGNLARQFFMSLLANPKHTVLGSIDRGILQFDLQIQVIPYSYATFRKKVYRRSQLILVRDPDKYHHLVAVGDYRTSRIVLDYNRVSVKPFDEASFAAKNSRQPVDILFLNGFSVERSPETLVRAAPLLLQRFPEARFTIVGSRSELERKRVLDIVDELNLGDYVKLYNWDPDASRYYERSVIYVMAAKFVYCNIALLEAMERGLVPVVSDVDKADLIVKNGVNGFVFNDTIEDIVEKLSFLMANPSKRIEMGLRARDTIREEFNIDNRMQVIDEEIAKLQPAH